uniref:Protein kinase domain-containing protein n=1 Tax=Oryzias latipes TaxID=8090 RepID=A0A3P9JZF7_ORYLA
MFIDVSRRNPIKTTEQVQITTQGTRESASLNFFILTFRPLGRDHITSAPWSAPSAGPSNGLTSRTSFHPWTMHKLYVVKILGEGCFGKVAKCTKLGSQEMYAIKIIANVQEGKEEFESMKLIQVLDPEVNHLMKMYECFSFQNVICLVYEILEESLEDFLNKNECEATPLTYVRAIAQQMFQALKALKSIGVVHCDIKLDNIMFAEKKSLKFKLIDFGVAVETKELPIGAEIQATPFRAPEVILGLPLNESIDMWALGMVLIFGLPEEELLSAGLNTQEYFTWDSSVNGWRLYTIHQMQFDMYDDDDHKAFIDLLKRMLDVSPQSRITPSQALEHDFITMQHLVGKKCSQDFSSDKHANEAMSFRSSGFKQLILLFDVMSADFRFRSISFFS